MVGDPGVIVMVGDEVAEDPPPRVARIHTSRQSYGAS